VRVAFDIGGTFTDLVLADVGRSLLLTEKLLGSATDIAAPVVEGVGRLMARAERTFEAVDTMIVGATTLVANAIIERKGARTALIVTKGFRDMIAMARERRYDSQRIDMPMPEPLVGDALTFEIGERIDRDGRVITAPGDEDIQAVVRALAKAKVQAVAVCLLHAYQNGIHEQQLRAAIEAALPDVFVSLSGDVSPEIGEYARACTTIANAYVQPYLKGQLTRLSKQLKALGYRDELYIMLSNGGTVSLDGALQYPIRLIESGPAAGALASRYFSMPLPERNFVSFDMGGTTAKACLVHGGRPSITKDFEAARVERFSKGSGIPLRVPVMDMIEIGAGGGSIARMTEAGFIKVGPDSAGSMPGPACYRLGGTEPTVTDADLLLGYLDADYFAGGQMSLDKEVARLALQALAGRLGLSLIQTAWGVHELVNENMAQATKVHIAEYGRDPAGYAMVALGGAGPVHARGVARKVGIRKVVIPSLAGVGSAFGLLVSPVAADFWRTRVMPTRKLSWPAVSTLLAELKAEAATLLARSRASGALDYRCSVEARYVGQGFEVDVELTPECLAESVGDEIGQRFEDEYERLYGRRIAGADIEVVTWRVSATGAEPGVGATLEAGARASRTGPLEEARKRSQAVYFPETDGFVEVPVFDHYKLAAGDAIEGPAIVQQRESTIVVGPGERIEVDRRNSIVLHL